jgi:hypothetical protein
LKEKRDMRKKLMILVAMLAMMLVVAGPASAEDLDGDELLFGFPAFSVIDDVDVDNVRERNPLDGECVVGDIDLHGFIAEYEITCYV